jgi:hypothetical protein
MRCVICDVLLPTNHRLDICQVCNLSVREAITDYYLLDSDAEVVNLLERIRKCQSSDTE